MTKPRHSLTDIDEASRTATCAVCGPGASIRPNRGPSGRIWRCYVSKHGEPYAARVEVFAERKSGWGPARLSGAERKRRSGYGRHKQDRCDRCGFVAEHRSQLDVHHRDGNHANNEISNLQTLCANCHRLTHHGAEMEAAAAPD